MAACLLRRAQQVVRGRTAVTLDECDAALAARGIQTREATIVYRARRRGGRYYLLSSGGRRRRCRVGGALPMTNIRLTVQDGGSHAQTCTGAPLRYRLCRRDIEAGAHSATCVGRLSVIGRAAARCRGRRRASMTNTRLTVQHGCSRPQPCTSMSLGSPLPPRHRGRGARSATWATLCPREGGGGGVGGLRRAPGCKKIKYS